MQPVSRITEMKKKNPKLMIVHLEMNEHKELQSVASQESPVDAGGVRCRLWEFGEIFA